MNMHHDSMNEMVAYHQQKLAEEFAATQGDSLWRVFRFQVAHALMRAGESLDRGCREHMTPPAGRSTTVMVGGHRA